jgi:hypothetical protein
MTLHLFQVHSYIALKQFRHEFSAFNTSREYASLRFEINSRVSFHISEFTDNAPLFRMKVQKTLSLYTDRLKFSSSGAGNFLPAEKVCLL